MQLQIINGPNLNLLGTREPDVYGKQDFETYLTGLIKKYPAIEIGYFQSNVEGELINELHRCGFNADGIILNAGGYTHTSIAIGDAVASIKSPVIEVHVSNVFAREEYRHHSFLSKHCKGIITGLGLKVYDLAVQYFIHNP